MELPFQFFVKLMKDLFKRLLREAVPLQGCGFLVSIKHENEELNLMGHLEFAHSHWTTAPFSANLRVKNLPVNLSSGTGTVDLTLLIMPVQDKKSLDPSRVNINRVIRFQGQSINQFESQLKDTFAEEWNRLT